MITPIIMITLLSNYLAHVKSHLNGRSFTSMSISNKACFGAGCYWGTEKFIKVDFGKKKFPGSIISGAVGFMGPKQVINRQVCSGSTGYVEVYDFTFNGDEKTYEELVKHFYSFHDPTTLNRQGNDMGTQYASVIFCYDEKQKEIAKKVTDELQANIEKGRNPYGSAKIPFLGGNVKVTTEIREATPFYKAQEDHQEYLDKNPWGYCNHGYRFLDWNKAFA